MTSVHKQAGLAVTAAIVVTAALMIVDAAQRPGMPPGRGQPGAGRPPAVGASTLSRVVAADAGSASAPVLIDIGIHIEPFGANVSELAGRPPRPAGAGRAGRGGPGARQPDFNEPEFFARHAADLRQVAALVEKAGGRLTVQAQTPFTTVAASSGERVLADLEAKGHEIALHFHEDAHLGPRSETLPVSAWTAVLKEQLAAIAKAGVTRPIVYWSGGNLYPQLLQAASAAGLKYNSDFKNPRTQETPAELLGIFPWRPAGGASESDVAAFARHDPAGPIVFLPEGDYPVTDFAASRRAAGGDYAYFDSVTEALERSLRAARPDRVNVFHVTFHTGEFRGQPGRPFDVIEQWLTKVVAPLARSRKVRWATYSQMAAAYEAWEREHPGVDPRSATAASPAAASPAVPSRGASPAGYLTFAVNVHDWRNVGDSADTVIRAAQLFKKYGVHGDFYLTAPMVAAYAKQRPDAIATLKSTGMTISYHVRAPHPLYEGFDGVLNGLDDAQLRATLRDYETYALDLRTGALNRGAPGGYSYVASVMGTAPVVIGTATQRDRRVRTAALDVYKSLGAKMFVQYHEQGGDPAQPFEVANGLLVRPSHFSITRWMTPTGSMEAFWWNQLNGRGAEWFDPAKKLELYLKEWKAPQPPFATALIHENNFYRFGPESWTSVYYADREARRVLAPPFNLDAADLSRERPAAEQRKIWDAYEALVKYAASRVSVVTSADIVALAKR